MGKKIAPRTRQRCKHKCSLCVCQRSQCDSTVYLCISMVICWFMNLFVVLKSKATIRTLPINKFIIFSVCKSPKVLEFFSFFFFPAGEYQSMTHTNRVQYFVTISFLSLIVSHRIFVVNFVVFFWKSHAYNKEYVGQMNSVWCAKFFWI